MTPVPAAQRSASMLRTSPAEVASVSGERGPFAALLREQGGPGGADRERAASGAGARPREAVADPTARDDGPGSLALETARAAQSALVRDRVGAAAPRPAVSEPASSPDAQSTARAAQEPAQAASAADHEGGETADAAGRTTASPSRVTGRPAPKPGRPASETSGAPSAGTEATEDDAAEAPGSHRGSRSVGSADPADSTDPAGVWAGTPERPTLGLAGSAAEAATAEAAVRAASQGDGPAAAGGAGPADLSASGPSSGGPAALREAAPAGTAGVDTTPARDAAEPASGGAAAAGAGRSDFAALLGAATAAAPTASGAVPDPVVTVSIDAALDDPDFTHQVSLQIGRLAREGVEQATLQLHPTELGPVAVRIVVEAGEARVGFEAAREDTRAALQASLGDLERRFQDDGLRLTEASVAPLAEAGSASGGRTEGEGSGAFSSASSDAGGNGAGAGRGSHAGREGAADRDGRSGSAPTRGQPAAQAWQMTVRADVGAVRGAQAGVGAAGRLDLYA